MGVSGVSNNAIVLKGHSDRYGALREPLMWQPVWVPDNFNGWNFWMPVGALGIYCHHEPGEPSKDETKGLVTVHRSLVKECGFETPDVWDTNLKVGGRENELTLGRLPHMALWPAHTNDPKAGDLPLKHTLKNNVITYQK